MSSVTSSFSYPSSTISPSPFGRVSSGPSGFIKPFEQASQVAPSATKDFLQSNSLVARFAFLLLVIIAFVVL